MVSLEIASKESLVCISADELSDVLLLELLQDSKIKTHVKKANME